jgi:Uncharacterized conserved protein (DUF2285)/Family of unknown function (DUF6499)
MYWNVPSWKDKELYPASTSKPTIWAWEFLRRNAGYRATWMRYNAALRQAATSLGLHDYILAVLADTPVAWSTLRRTIQQNIEAEIESQTSDQIKEQSDLERQTEKIMHIWSGMVNDELTKILEISPQPPFTRPEQILANEFGIDWLISPNWVSEEAVIRCRFTDDPKTARKKVMPSLEVENTHRASIGQKLSLPQLGANLKNFLGSKSSSRVFSTPNWQMIAFDLRLPIAPQIAGLQQELEEEAKQRAEKKLISRLAMRRFEKRHFQTYLRSLDAIASGATMDEIVSVLLPHELPINNTAGGFAPRKKVEKWLAAAERLRDMDYRRLALSM